MYQQFRGAQRRARQLGVTLIESLVTLGIAGVLAAVGVPSLSDFRAKGAVDAQFHTLESSLRRARSEAMTRGEQVTVCALDAESVKDGAPACAESGKDWSNGWLVFVDREERGEVDEDDQIIAVHQVAATEGVVIGTARYLTYRPTGVLLSIAAHFRILPPGANHADTAAPGSVLVCVNKPGKPRVAKESSCRG